MIYRGVTFHHPTNRSTLSLKDNCTKIERNILILQVRIIMARGLVTHQIPQEGGCRLIIKNPHVDCHMRMMPHRGLEPLFRP